MIEEPTTVRPPARPKTLKLFLIGLGVRLIGLFLIWAGDGHTSVLSKAVVVVGAILSIGGIGILKWLSFQSRPASDPMTVSTQTAFSPGFRLSKIDIAALLLGGAAAAVAGSYDVWFGVAIAFVVCHFFLFCNVLRMAPKLELIWAGTFIMLATLAAVFRVIGWPVVLGISLLMTIILAIIQARRPSYHGIGWRKLNPDLPRWWDAQRNSRVEMEDRSATEPRKAPSLI